MRELMSKQWMKDHQVAASEKEEEDMVQKQLVRSQQEAAEEAERKRIGAELEKMQTQMALQIRPRRTSDDERDDKRLALALAKSIAEAEAPVGAPGAAAVATVGQQDEQVLG